MDETGKYEEHPLFLISGHKVHQLHFIIFTTIHAFVTKAFGTSAVKESIVV